mmetsp:Transcript_27445/g.64561  ORF Transcript_27445/g.64561 Transcript_27445/m.64561 type:complete len:106 (+) Transcript_27445:546-863(+)
MSIGDQFTDSDGVASGLRVKLPNFWFDSSRVPNPLGNGGKVHLDEHGTFPPGNEHCELNCVIGPDDACLEASLKDDAIYRTCSSTAWTKTRRKAQTKSMSVNTTS